MSGIAESGELFNFLDHSERLGRPVEATAGETIYIRPPEMTELFSSHSLESNGAWPSDSMDIDIL